MTSDHPPKSDFACSVVTTPRGLSDNQAVRFAVFAETTYYDPRSALAPREADELDTLPETMLLNLYSGDRPVGAARLLLPNDEVARHNGWELGLPIEARFSLAALHEEGPLGEGGRFCVLPAFHGTRAASLLMEALFGECRARGVRNMVACANAETDSEEDARLQGLALAARGLVSDRYRLERRGVDSPPKAPRRPFYDEGERRAFGEGAARLRVPRTLALYGRFGARFVGDAVFDERFGLFAFPMLLPVPSRPRVFRGRSHGPAIDQAA